MIDYFEKALAGVKRARRVRRIQAVAEIIAGIVTIAATARIIELGQPWWLTTLGALLVAGWALQAARTSRQLEAYADDQEKLQTILCEANNAAGLLRDLGMPEELLRKFTGAQATTVLKDDDPDAMPMPAPAAEPEQKS
jgi:hypothetical protein